MYTIEMEQPPLLMMRGVCKSFDGVPVLSDVDFSLRKGEVVGLLGENGAGKSTLMKILCGIYKADRGAIFLEGSERVFLTVASALSSGVVLIHQELNLLDNLDVATNIFLGREPKKYGFLLDNEELYRKADAILKRLKVKFSSGALVSDLSIAEQQIVEIAKALSQNARILIMDEPTSSLSLPETQVLFEVIADLSRHGVAIIYISHRLNEIYEIADRVVVLKDGRNSGELEKSGVNRDSIVRLMVGRNIEATYETASSSVTEYDFEISDVVTQRYPDKKVNFKIGRGEIVGLAGLVGAGRTELVNSIFGVTPLVSGKIFLMDRQVSVHQPETAIRSGIFLVPEDRRRQGVFTEMDVVDNVTITSLGSYSCLGYIRTNLTQDATATQINRLNIKSSSSKTLVKFLSGGNQQKVAIAKWLTMIPELMIFDEPTRGVDIGAKSEIYNIMRQIANKGTMILVVSSDMEEIITISDRIIVMHEGSITGELNRAEFDEEKIMGLAVGN